MLPLTSTLVTFLFFSTGFAGLIYEVVWLRMLVRVFGSTSLAASNVLAIFMAGLALGAEIAGRRATRAPSPLRAYGWVECGLAVAASVATCLLTRLPAFAASAGPHGAIDSPAVIAFRTALSAAALLLPTALMGASFPLITERFSRGRDTASPGQHPAILYGVNALGAALGVLACGYYLLGRFGESATIAIAVGINVVVGLGAVLIARSDSPSDDASPPKRNRTARADAPSALAGKMPVLMALSGFCALSLEVLWTRLLVLLVGNSIYAFSSMLAASLLGIGLGSVICARWLKKNRNRAVAFIALQLLAAGGIALSLELYLAEGLSRADPFFLYSPIRTAMDFYGLLAVSAGIILPVSLVYGLIFPLAIAIVDPRGSGEAAGRTYTLNTAGSVLGALACGLFLIPAMGTRDTLYALAALHLLVAAVATFWSGEGSWGALGLSAAALAALAILRPDPFLEIIKARLQKRGPGEINFHLEGASSTVTEYVREGREHLILINGIIVSGKGDLGRMMAHFPLILQEAPKRALVICLGAGNTFRAAVDHGVEVDLSELEPEVVAGFPKLWPDARLYLDNPRAHVHVNDGRNFLLSSDAFYDMIVVDGTPPIFSAGTVNLYSLEFVRLARRRMTKTGILALWVPLPCFERDFWMIAKNFTEAFGHTLAWAQPGLQGVLLMGSEAPLGLSPEFFKKRVLARGLSVKNRWLNETLLDSRRIVTDAALRSKTAGFPNVTDDMPYTEFPLPLFAAGTPLRTEPDFLPFSGGN